MASPRGDDKAVILNVENATQRSDLLATTLPWSSLYVRRLLTTSTMGGPLFLMTVPVPSAILKKILKNRKYQCIQ